MDISTLAVALGYTKKQVEQAKREGFRVQIEQDRSILETTGEEKIFYFLPKTSDNPTDGYDEFVYTNNNWEQVGVTDIDLSSYATKAEVGNLNNLPTTDKSSIVSAISEIFTSVSNGKSLVASAITDKGISTSSDATFEIMAQNIEAIPTGSPTVLNPALVLWDWEGTKLGEYSAEDVLALTELPTPDTLPAYADVDHELLLFQEWNWSLANIKTWIQNHEDETLDVGAIYTTTDGQNHNYWDSPRGEGVDLISRQRRGEASIGDEAFNAYCSLASINIPDGVTSIGINAFAVCRSLKSINIPDSVTSIEASAFNGCYSLKSINISDSVTSIGSYAFGGCYSLTLINIPDSVTSIGSHAFDGCYSLKSINISDSVTSIGSYAFGDCSSLTLINIPDSVTSIGDFAFNACCSLTSINIPDGVTSIGINAFENCCSLTSINIPDSVTSIGHGAFINCNNLFDILLEGKPAFPDFNVFAGVPSTVKIYVPRENLSWFEAITDGTDYYSIFTTIEDNIAYLESLGYNVDEYKG